MSITHVVPFMIIIEGSFHYLYHYGTKKNVILIYVYVIHACHLDAYLLLRNELAKFHNVDIINDIDSTFFWDIDSGYTKDDFCIFGCLVN
jgi:hypothetical protein